MFPCTAPQTAPFGGLVPQLADSIDPTTLDRYLRDERWWFEQKVDGRRKLVALSPVGVAVLNRAGEPSTLPADCRVRLPVLATGEVVLDGELVGQTLWVFDIPLAPPAVAPATPYAARRDVLDRLAPKLETATLRVLPVARTPEEKTRLAAKVRDAGGEGLILKDVTCPYRAGRRHRGLLKAKFVHDVDAVVTRIGVDGKQNCAVGVYDDNGRLVEVGTVIVHARERAHLQVGSVVTVAYLYCVDTAAPRLVQPTRLRLRDDKHPEECTMHQLRFTDRTVHDLT